MAGAAKRLQVAQVESQLGRRAHRPDVVDFQPLAGAAFATLVAVPAQHLRPKRAPALRAGDVILEIGTFAGRSAFPALRGALANPARTEPPQFHVIDIPADSMAETREAIARANLTPYCHLFQGVLKDFVQRWSITPTMVFLDGDHSYDGVRTDLEILSRYLKPGTPILVHDFVKSENDEGAIGARKAAQEWSAAGHARFMGCFGCCALYVTAVGGL